MKPHRLLAARTRDGWEIAIHHWSPPRGAGEAGAAGEPVLLCHGLASCARSFEFEPGQGLAPWLAARGHPVFALDLRGAGASEKPRLGGKRSFSWGVHEYLTQDVPAAIHHVLAETGKERLHFVGHSMGGVLLLAFAASELGERLASAVVVASTLDYKVGSDFGRVKTLFSLLRLLPVAPVSTLARGYAPFAGQGYLDEFMFARESLTPAEKQALWRSAFSWIPGLVLRELATTFEKESFRGRDGVRWRDTLPRIRAPLLFLAGTRDRQCSVAASRATFEATGSARKKLVVYDGLGHFDLIFGARAQAEVYPEIAGWLAGGNLEGVSAQDREGRLAGLPQESERSERAAARSAGRPGGTWGRSPQDADAADQPRK